MLRLKFFFSFLFITQTLLFSQSWTKITDFPSAERDDGTYFIIGNKVFCGTGFKVGYLFTKDIYSFDMTTETWDTATSLPNGMERQYACGFSYKTSGFIFGGVGNGYLNDLWMYDEGTKKWQAKSPLPAVGRMGSSCFVIKDTAYIIGGRTATASSISDVWAYNMLTDTWTPKNSLPFGARWRAAATDMNNKGYLLFGKDASNAYRKELYEFDPSTNNWTQLTSFPDKGRTYAAIKSMNNTLLVFAGIDSLNTSHDDFWRFDFNSMNWKQLASIPAEGRRGGMCFNSSTSLYYTTGVSQSNNRLKETWKVFNPTSIYKNELDECVDVYPNPVSDQLTIAIKTQELKFDAIEIRNAWGQLVRTVNVKFFSGNKIKIDFNGLPQGLYVITFIGQQGAVVKKILKN